MTHMWKKATDGPSDLPRMLHPHFPRKPTTILVVEDNPDDAELIAAVLATGLSYTQVDVAFTPKLNTWRGETTIQMHLKDIRGA